MSEIKSWLNKNISTGDNKFFCGDIVLQQEIDFTNVTGIIPPSIRTEVLKRGDKQIVHTTINVDRKQLIALSRAIRTFLREEQANDN